jgi:hypothetical protein
MVSQLKDRAGPRRGPGEDPVTYLGDQTIVPVELLHPSWLFTH